MGTHGTVLAISQAHGSQGKVEIQLQGATLWEEVGKGCHKEMQMQKQGEGGGGLPQPSPGLPDAPAHSRERGGTEMASYSTDGALWAAH